VVEMLEVEERQVLLTPQLSSPNSLLVPSLLLACPLFTSCLSLTPDLSPPYSVLTHIPLFLLSGAAAGGAPG